MIALAKIGLDPSILEKMKKKLRSRDQEISETATLAIGIANLEEGVPDLFVLAKDTPSGRKLVNRDRTPFRTRSFACYGLGLIAYATKDNALKRKVFEEMKVLIEKDSLNNRDIKVAAFQAIRLLRPSLETKAGKSLAASVIEFLTGYLAKQKANKQVQSHAYTAIADLVGRGDHFDTHGNIRETVSLALKDRKNKHWIHQSAALALGQMGTPEDSNLCKILQEYMVKGKNQQAKSFCAISLGQIGGPGNRDFLISKLRQKRTKTLLKPWISLGLAIESFRQREMHPTNPQSSAAKEVVYSAFKKEKNRLTASAFALSLGLMQAKDATVEVIERMQKYRNTQQACGYMALALGLLGGEGKNEINSIVDRSSHFETLLSQASISLGLLGDKEIGSRLIKKMKDPSNGLAVQSALAQALGFIGDKRSIRPLVEIMQDSKSFKNIPRAFAAVALGLICDKEEFPWNSKISRNINYRANTETLTGASTGVLDIL
jgi:HEAT repeat protein